MMVVTYSNNNSTNTKKAGNNNNNSGGPRAARGKATAGAATGLRSSSFQKMWSSSLVAIMPALFLQPAHAWSLGQLRELLTSAVYPAAGPYEAAPQCTIQSCPGLDEGNQNGMCTYQIKYSASGRPGAEEDQHGYMMYPCFRRGGPAYDIQKEHFDRGPVSLKELDKLWYKLPQEIGEPSSSAITDIYFVAGGNGMRARETLPFFSGVVKEAKRSYEEKIANTLFLFVDMPGYGNAKEVYDGCEPPNGGYPSPSTSFSANKYLLDTVTDIINRKQESDGVQIQTYNFFGHSMGSANVLQMATHRDFRQKTKRIALYAPFDSTFSMLDSMIDKAAEQVPVLKIVKSLVTGTASGLSLFIRQYNWDNIAAVKKLEKVENPEALEIVIMHSALDEVVPIANGMNLVNSIPAEIRNVKHFVRHKSVDVDDIFHGGQWHDPRDISSRHEDVHSLFSRQYPAALFGDFESAPGEFVEDHDSSSFLKSIRRAVNYVSCDSGH